MNLIKAALNLSPAGSNVVLATLLSVGLVSCSSSPTESNSTNTNSDTGQVTVVSSPENSPIGPVAEQVEKIVYTSNFVITDPRNVAPGEAFTIAWTENANAIDYDIVIATDEECSTPVEYFGDQTITELEASPLVEGRYFICLYGIEGNTVITAADNSPYEFDVKVPPPGSFEIDESQSIFNIDNPTFSWTVSENATEYELIIATDVTCETPIETISGLTTTTAQISPTADGTYYLCVDATQGTSDATTAYNSPVVVVIDTNTPLVLDMSTSKSDGSYKAGEVIPIQVTWNENVYVSGTTGSAGITLETGATDRQATYVSGSGSPTLTFNYTVQSGDTSVQLDRHSTDFNLALTGDYNIADNVGITATLNLSTVDLNLHNIIIDTTASVVTNIGSVTTDAAYSDTQSIDIQVTYDEPVYVNTTGGTPSFSLDSGGTATYIAGSGTDNLSFTYTIVNGENSTDLDVTGSISLNGATMKDLAGNESDGVIRSITLPETGAGLGAVLLATMLGVGAWRRK